MPKHGCACRRVIWGLLVIGVAGVALTAASLPRTFRPVDVRAFGARYELWIEDGRFGALRTTTKGTQWGAPLQIYWGGHGAPAPLKLGFGRMKARALSGAATASTDGALIPIWFVALLLGAAWAGLVLTSARRRPGCSRCGYDTAGLETCPECGRPSEPRA